MGHLLFKPSNSPPTFSSALFSSSDLVASAKPLRTREEKASRDTCVLLFLANFSPSVAAAAAWLPPRSSYRYCRCGSIPASERTLSAFR